MTPPQIEPPHDPLFDPLLRRLGPWRFALAGLLWAIVVDLGAYLILRSVGMDARLLHDDPALRRIVLASQLLINLGGPLIIWALYGWLRRASARLMEDLIRRGIFFEQPPAHVSHADVSHASERRITAAWGRRAWIMGLAIACAGAIQHLTHPPGWNEASALHAQLHLAASMPLWYVLWMSVATAAATAEGLRAAFARYQIRIHVFHPDGYGGLGPLRAFIGTLISFMLTISALLAAAVALATVTANSRATGSIASSSSTCLDSS